jgi:hypothetical protein
VAARKPRYSAPALTVPMDTPEKCSLSPFPRRGGYTFTELQTKAHTWVKPGVYERKAKLASCWVG